MSRPRPALSVLAAILLAACGSGGPDASAGKAGASAGGSPDGTAASPEPASDARVAAAVLAAPEPLRSSATVLAPGESAELETLRPGDGPLRCLADDPSDDRFQVTCYHESLEAFMARGRELRAGGVTGSEVDSVRFREIEAGELAMPDHPAALYTLAGPEAPSDPTSGTVPEKAERLFVLYVPGMDARRIGLPAKPVEGYPWLMSGGSPKAHVMVTP